MKAPDKEGIVRTEWKPVTLPHAPVSAIRAAATITTPKAPLERKPPSAEALYDQRVAAWEKRIEEAVDDANENGDGDLTAAELAPWIAANVLEAVDREIAGVIAKLRTECGTLRRELEAADERRMDERRKRVTGAAALKKQIADLEAAQRAQAEAHKEALATMGKAVAAVELGLARDRSLRRMTDARRSYPRADRLALETARRATDLAVAGTELDS
jgi:hypothetical protein